MALLKKWDLWVRAIKALIFYILAPSAITLSQLVSYGAHLGSRIPALANAFFESETLKEKLHDYAFLQAQVHELEEENRRLREIFGFDRKSFPQAVTCEVIGRDPTNWFSSVVIDRGQKDGIKSGSPVVAYYQGRIGLVGSVEEVAKRSAKVLLISDTLSSISVSIGQDRELAVLQGQGSHELLLTYIVPQAKIQAGDEILTAGLGESFPPGLPVGFLREVEPPSSLSFRKAFIDTYAPLSRLREVMVLSGKKRISDSDS